jgi:hypothetical protein
MGWVVPKKPDTQSNQLRRIVAYLQEREWTSTKELRIATNLTTVNCNMLLYRFWLAGVVRRQQKFLSNGQIRQSWLWIGPKN